MIQRSPLAAMPLPAHNCSLASFLLDALDKRPTAAALIDGLSGAVTTRRQLKGTHFFYFEEDIF